LPSDPASIIAGGNNRTPDPLVVEQVRERYGLNDPVLQQFLHYWGRVLHWDLGTSFNNGQSVNALLAEKAPRSIRLAIWATIIEVIVGISVGLISAVKRYSLVDKLTTVATTAAAAIPAFVLGYLLQYIFAVTPEKRNWPDWLQLKTSRLGPDSWFLFFIPTSDQWRYLILPSITLACVSTALAARMMRGSMLEVLKADFMRTAKSKGLGERAVIFRHGLRNALIPVITLIGIDFGTVVGAAVLTETVFSWPGIGSQIVDSVFDRDLPVILGLSLVVVIAYVTVNLIVDMSYAWFDPRIRLGERVGG
ncbi:MAG: ABC transporter permease, partial [Actinomycetota bacterium]|nr:ABC transporter permease [Actinomycetota bacterium]